ncbi:MAG: cation:proton antiporter [Alphaproteobacteria bacterium]|nr:monovalent cation/H+ antiporter complex subunit F [Alphaproteobacteria bacterium]TAD90220.1 MAG: cation:proton antiporter [Alphaproteobacteria bacterium]
MSFLGLCLTLAMVLIAGAILAVAWRLLAGPSSADRVIATDMLGLLAIALAALVAGLTGQQAFLDVALGIAVFGFLAAIAFACLLERTSATQEGPR